MKHLVFSALLVVALGIAGCSNTKVAPRGVSVIETQGSATLQINTAVWDRASSSVRLYGQSWQVDLYPAKPGLMSRAGSEDPEVVLELPAYERLTVQFVDGKGTVVRQQELTRPARAALSNEKK